MEGAGKYIIMLGLVMVAVGLLVYFAGDYLKWLGRLPGDIRIDRGHYKICFPMTTMILVSIVLTLIINLFRRIF